MTARLRWVLAAPFLALAGLAAATYTAAVWAAETVADLDPEKAPYSYDEGARDA